MQFMIVCQLNVKIIKSTTPYVYDVSMNIHIWSFIQYTRVYDTFRFITLVIN